MKRKCVFCGHNKIIKDHCEKCYKLQLKPIKIGAAK
jgi:primosomal protein N'